MLTHKDELLIAKPELPPGDGLQVVVHTVRHLCSLPGGTSSNIPTRAIITASKSSSVIKAETYRGCFPRFSTELLESQLSFVLRVFWPKVDVLTRSQM